MKKKEKGTRFIAVCFGFGVLYAIITHSTHITPYHTSRYHNISVNMAICYDEEKENISQPTNERLNEHITHILYTQEKSRNLCEKKTE